MRKQTHENATTRWLSFKSAAKYSGLSVRTIQNYAIANLIRVSNVIVPGASRGRRLVDLASLDAFIDAGVGLPPAKIALNTKRGKRGLQ